MLGMYDATEEPGDYIEYSYDDVEPDEPEFIDYDPDYYSLRDDFAD